MAGGEHAVAGAAGAGCGSECAGGVGGADVDRGDGVGGRTGERKGMGMLG